MCLYMLASKIYTIFFIQYYYHTRSSSSFRSVTKVVNFIVFEMYPILRTKTYNVVEDVSNNVVRHFSYSFVVNKNYDPNAFFLSGTKYSLLMELVRFLTKIHKDFTLNLPNNWYKPIYSLYMSLFDNDYLCLSNNTIYVWHHFLILYWIHYIIFCIILLC